MLYRDLDYNKYENQLLYNKIDRFQIQQDINGDLKILLKMKSKDEESLGLFSYIVKNYERVFIGSSICLEFVDRIASLPSGKEDFVISHYQKKRTEDERTI